MDSRSYRRIAEAKRIFQQAPEKETVTPNRFGLEERKVAAPIRNTPMSSLPHLQAPPVESGEPAPESEAHVNVPTAPATPAAQKPKPTFDEAYERVKQAADANPDNETAQAVYQEMTKQKLGLSGSGKPRKVDTEVFLRATERQKISQRSMELANRRKLSTASERPSFFS
jgi:hypothetical protein